MIAMVAAVAFYLHWTRMSGMDRALFKSRQEAGLNCFFLRKTENEAMIEGGPA